MIRIQIGDLVYFTGRSKSGRTSVLKLYDAYDGFPLASTQNRVVLLMYLFTKLNKCFPIKIYESSLTFLRKEVSQTDYS